MLSNTTAYDIIVNALQIVGVIGYGEGVDPMVAKTSLQMLNAVLAEWSAKPYNYKKYDQLYTATTNQYSVSLGSSSTVSGDILERPAAIEQVVISFGTNNYEIPIKSYEEYRQLTITNIFSLPSVAYIDTDYPIQNIYLFPGLAVGYKIRVTGRAYLTEFENVTDAYNHPPELFQCLVLALALKIAPMFGTDPNSMIGIQQALSSALKPLKAIVFKNRMQRAKNDLFPSTGSINFFAGV